MSEDEILQISNDISEDELSPKVTKAQLVEVIEFWQNLSHERAQEHSRFKGDLAVMFAKLLSQ